MNFNDQYLNILSLSPVESVRGVQWALDKASSGGQKFRLYPSSLSALSTDLDLSTIDLVWIGIDMGQPVPVEILSKIARFPTLCSFIHPTPAQLLSVGDFQKWSVMAWDGSAFDKVAAKIMNLTGALKEEMSQRHFLEGCRAWIHRSEEIPDYLEWSNCPEDFISPRLYSLDPQFGILTMGTEGSGTMIRLPLGNKSSPKELGEFRFVGGNWKFKAFSSDLPVEVRGSGEKLKPGDQVTLGDWIFNLKRSPRVDEIVKLARSYHVFDDLEVSTSKNNNSPTLAEVCKDFLHSGVRGELRVTSGLKNGSVYFEDAKIIHSRTGSVSGRKALLRLLAWGEVQWKFTSGRMPVPDRRTLSLDFSQFSRMHQLWKKQWQQVSSFSPPLHLKLKVSAPKFLLKKRWNQKESLVLASVCEFAMVRDIMNFCLLDDVEIVETLVQMRKLGLVEPVKAQTV